MLGQDLHYISLLLLDNVCISFKILMAVIYCFEMHIKKLFKSNCNPLLWIKTIIFVVKWDFVLSAMVNLSLSVTPLDVVKIRLQTQHKMLTSNKCFTYCNGLMDHMCPCINGGETHWYRRPSKFNGTLVQLACESCQLS